MANLVTYDQQGNVLAVTDITAALAAETAAVQTSNRAAAAANIQGVSAPEYVLMRAVVLATVSELNLLREWLVSFQAAAAAATSLANLQTRIAALPAMPDRNNAQVITAIVANINSGAAD